MRITSPTLSRNTAPLATTDDKHPGRGSLAPALAASENTSREHCSVSSADRVDSWLGPKSFISRARLTMLLLACVETLSTRRRSTTRRAQSTARISALLLFLSLPPWPK